MFNSRGPRSTEEIQDCISLLSKSPFWTDPGPDLTEQDMAQCWEKLLRQGKAIIDIIDNDAANYRANLRDPKRVEESPHFKHGFFCVWFVCYISKDFACEILGDRDDSVDPMILFMQRYMAYVRDRSKPSPAVRLGKDGEVPNDGLYGFSLVVFHPNAIFNPLRQIHDVAPYQERMVKSIQLSCNGFNHKAWINLHPGTLWLDKMIKFGYALVRPYSDNAKKSKKLKKFILCTTRDEEVARELKISSSNAITSQLKSSARKFEYRGNAFMFQKAELQRKAELNHYQQHVGYLLSLGWSAEDMLKPAKRSSAGAINTCKNQIGVKLQEAGYILFEPNKSIMIADLQACLKDEAAHEIREFMFSIFPWPERLASRPTP